VTILDANKARPIEGGASFTLGNRLTRILWNAAWLLLASWTPAPLHRYRVALLRLFGGQVDWTAHVYGSAQVWLPSNLRMAAHSCLGPRVNCYCMDVISIGEGAVVSQGTTLCAGSHDIADPNFQLITKPIVIESNAWVAAEAFIGPGAIVGESAVIGARAVLFGRAEPLGVYVGNPAVKVKTRNNTADPNCPST
jgi:putative colanic acid biosynthesis acetyltransferase WcaF